MATLKDLIKLTKELPEDAFLEAYEKLSEIKKLADEREKNAPVTCINCKSLRVVKNGKSSGRQAYLCRDCKKGFLEVSTSGISNSHQSPAVWRTVIEDTILGVSLAKTANDLDISEQTAFNMRHKILYAVEQAILANPVMLEGACEVDETYILECEKGTPFPHYHHREPRNNGKSSSRGLNEEFICLCTGITSEGRAIACAINRATPSKEEIKEVFENRIEDDTILLVDGNKSYNALKGKAAVIRVETGENVRISRFHSFIKSRLASYRGVATKFLNRYAAMFSEAFGNAEHIDKVADKIYELMTARNNSFKTHKDIAEENLLYV